MVKNGDVIDDLRELGRLLIKMSDLLVEYADARTAVELHPLWNPDSDPEGMGELMAINAANLSEIERYSTALAASIGSLEQQVAAVSEAIKLNRNVRRQLDAQLPDSGGLLN